MDIVKLTEIAKTIRRDIIKMTTEVNSAIPEVSFCNRYYSCTLFQGDEA